MAIVLIEMGAASGGTAATHTVAAGEGGFVQAIYDGDALANNDQKNMITVTFGTTTTMYRLAPGVPIPVGASISNDNETAFNILMNV